MVKTNQSKAFGRIKLPDAVLDEIKDMPYKAAIKHIKDCRRNFIRGLMRNYTTTENSISALTIICKLRHAGYDPSQHAVRDDMNWLVFSDGSVIKFQFDNSRTRYFWNESYDKPKQK